VIKKGKIVLDEERFALDAIIAEKQILFKSNAILLQRLGILDRIFAGVKAAMQAELEPALEQAQPQAQPQGQAQVQPGAAGQQ